MSGYAWGSDGIISMPEVLEDTDTDMVDFGGFCFTPDGVRINLNAAVREDIISHGYGPPQGAHDASR